MFERTKRQVVEPIRNTLRIALAALMVAIIALIAAVTR